VAPAGCALRVAVQQQHGLPAAGGHRNSLRPSTSHMVDLIRWTSPSLGALKDLVRDSTGTYSKITVRSPTP
jgi:hypothetical protein